MKTSFTLQPGLNSLIAAIKVDAIQAIPAEVPESQRAQYAMAIYLGKGIKAPVEIVGVDPIATNTHVYVIGQARPVYVMRLPVTEQRMAWYRSLGAPLGESVVFVAANLDWRAGPTLFEVDSELFVIPAAPRVIGVNWPDGDLEVQRARLAEEAAAKARSDNYSRVYVETAKQMGGTALANVQAFENAVLETLVPKFVPGASWQWNALFIAALVAAGAYAWSQFDPKVALLKRLR